MTFRRLLVAVDDSPAALAAARLAIELAAGWKAAVRAVTVVRDGRLLEAMDGREPGAADARRRLSEGARSVLAWVAELGAERSVPVETAHSQDADPFRAILAEAHLWEADLIIMGRSDRRGPSSPYLGSSTAHVLEFADVPVLVVPA